MAGGGAAQRAKQRAAKKRRAARRRHHAQAEAAAAAAALLPLDVIVEIAARSDPATLVRCAATCRDARHRIAQDPSLLGRLRLRDTERFVPSLLRGHMTGTRAYDCDFQEITDVLMVDTTTAADATHLVEATFAGADDTLRNPLLIDSRDGLVLVRAAMMTTTQNNMDQRQLLVVCNLATRRCQALPPDPAFPQSAVQITGESALQYVLLVGRSCSGDGADAAVGRPFHVVMAKLVLSKDYPSYRRLFVHTFSSEHGAWSPLTEIPTPNLHGSGKRLLRPLVIGDVVHWLCLTDTGSFMFMLRVGTALVNVTSLPANFPRDGKNHTYSEGHQYLLATATAGGNPIVLVADTDKISTWEQSENTKTWKPPQVVIENEMVLGFKDDALAELIEKERKWGAIWERKYVPGLLWFGERSGAVFLQIRGNHGGCLFWLDLHSKKIIRCFSNRWIELAHMYCPYEVDLSSWLPTFSSAITL